MKVVITGTSRGIGLELTHLGLAAGHEVMAVARQPEKSSALLRLKGEYKDRVELVTADLTSPDAASMIAALIKDWGQLDLLVNNAGIMRLGDLRKDFMESFLVNSVVPFEITKALVPYLEKATNPKVAHITSLMGSIADNGSGGYYAYRSSKTALNMINKSLALDHKNICSVVLHPGWVKTDMGGLEAPTSTAESAKGIWKVIDGLNVADSGGFFDFRGKELPW